MKRLIPREKLSKKARRKMDAEKRAAWAFSPVTRKIESKKIYNRKKNSRAGYEDGPGFFLLSQKNIFAAVFRFCA